VISLTEHYFHRSVAGIRAQKQINRGPDDRAMCKSKRTITMGAEEFDELSKAAIAAVQPEADEDTVRVFGKLWPQHVAKYRERSEQVFKKAAIAAGYGRSVPMPGVPQGPLMGSISSPTVKYLWETVKEARALCRRLNGDSSGGKATKGGGKQRLPNGHVRRDGESR
jgi:hypothetical protein